MPECPDGVSGLAGGRVGCGYIAPGCATGAIVSLAEDLLCAGPCFSATGSGCLSCLGLQSTVSLTVHRLGALAPRPLRGWAGQGGVPSPPQDPSLPRVLHRFSLARLTLHIWRFLTLPFNGRTAQWRLECPLLTSSKLVRAPDLHRTAYLFLGVRSTEGHTQNPGLGSWQQPGSWAGPPWDPSLKCLQVPGGSVAVLGASYQEVQ